MFNEAMAERDKTISFDDLEKNIISPLHKTQPLSQGLTVNSTRHYTLA